jgi:hypothetical protein
MAILSNVDLALAFVLGFVVARWAWLWQLARQEKAGLAATRRCRVLDMLPPIDRSADRISKGAHIAHDGSDFFHRDDDWQWGFR